MGKRFLTLNIGVANIELAEYEQGGRDALTLVKYGVAPLAAPLDIGNTDTILSPALLELVRTCGVKPGRLAVSISGQLVFPKFAAIPMAGGQERFEQMVRYEIEQGIPFPIDEMVCDRQILGDTENGDKSVMIVAAKVDQIEAIAATLQNVGFTPDLVDVAPLALVNAIRFTHPEEEGCVITLDIGAKTTSLVIVEGDKVYTRSIPIAGNALTKEIANALGCSMEEAEAAKCEKGYVSLGGVTEDADPTLDCMAKACRATMSRLTAEISRSINFYRSQQKGNAPAKLYLTGGTALLPQIDEFFTNELGIEVEFFNPFERIRIGSAVDSSALESDGARLAATAGLALHEIGSAHFAINLLPPSLVLAREEKAKVPFILVGGLTLTLALVFFGLGIGNEAAVVEAQRDAVQAKVTVLEKTYRKVTEAQKAFDGAQAEAETLRLLLTSRSAMVQRLTAVRTALLPGMWIDRWEAGRVTIRYWKDRVTASEGKTASESFVDKLKAKPGVDASAVRIADMSTVGPDGSVEQFTVEVKFK